MSLSRRTCLSGFLIITMLVASSYFFSGCDYARMRDQESVRTYEAEPPQAPQGTLPITGGTAEVKTEDPSKTQNPLRVTPQVLERGRTAYAYFCIQCHGSNLDGNGTVGQSFSPLPTDLRSSYVLQQKDGVLFYKISFGYKRHPPLATTVAVDDRWAIINYLRSVGKER